MTDCSRQGISSSPSTKPRSKECHLCPRTGVTHVSGPYTRKGRGQFTHSRPMTQRFNQRLDIGEGVEGEDEIHEAVRLCAGKRAAGELGELCHHVGARR